MDTRPPPKDMVGDMAESIGFSRFSVAVVVTDPRIEDNAIVYVNDAFERMTGYARSAAIGKNCRFLQGEETDARSIKRLRKAIEAKEEIALDLLNYRADGSTFTNRLIIAPITDDDGNCIYFVGVQKEMRDGDREATQETIDDQLVEIQHRVKNHLSMIVGMIRTQSRSASAPEEFAGLSRRIESLQLLYEEMSHAEAGNRDRLPLGTYLTRVANAIAHIDGRPGVRCVLDVEPVDTAVDTATRLGLVLSEVVTNAFQHAFEDRTTGVVDIRLITLSDGALRLTVSDDGTGIPEDVEWPSTTSMGGRILQGLIEGLNGSIDLTRGAAGTVVTIDLPKNVVFKHQTMNEEA